MLLHDVVDGAAAATPDAPALVAGGATTSFGDLAGAVARLAAVVQERTAPGDRVAVVADNCATWVHAYSAVPRAGRVLVFLNQRLAAAELRRTLAASGTTLLLGAEPHVGPLRHAVPEAIELDALEPLVAAAHPGPATPAPGGPGALAWLLFTSGTTGRPKGAMLTHRSLLAAVDVTLAGRPVADDDVYLFPFPLCHVAGYNVLAHHRRGRPVVLLPRFEPAAFVAAVAEHGVTSASLAATMLGALLDHVEATGTAGDLSSLRTIAYGAAPMPEALLRRADAVLGCEFAQGYGMTELSGNAVFLGPDDHRAGLRGADPEALRAAGRPGPGVSVRVVDAGGADVPPGGVGEIVVRGDQVAAGYWDDDEATAAAFVDGELRTGDLGRFDAAGRLHVVDRLKDVIVTGGENVSSVAVEDVLHRSPAVRGAAVIGVPDPRWGENVCAVVVPRPGPPPSAQELSDLVAAELGGFTRPRHVVFVEDLPRNAAGKVVKDELRQLVAEHPELLGSRLGEALTGVGSRILDGVGRLGGVLLCLAVFGVSFGESAVLLDFVVPGEVGMVVAGAAAKRNDVSPWLLVAIGTAGSVLGDSFSYVVGRRWGMALVRRWSWLRRRLEPRFERAHEYFGRGGGRAVFVARWVGALRALVPLVAGTSAMPYRRFLLWDALAAVLWVTTMVWLGALLGDDIARVVDRVGTLISVVVVAVIALVLVVRSQRRRSRPPAPAPGSGTPRSRGEG